MDKNTGVGLLLVVAILGGYMWWNSRNMEAYNNEQRRIKDSIAKITYPREETPRQIVPDSLQNANTRNIAVENLGETMASLLEGSEDFYTIENDKLIVTLTNKGARIWSVEFKDFQNYTNFKEKNNAPLKLFYGNSNNFSLELFLKTQNIKTSDFYFEPNFNGSNLKVFSDSLKVPFRLYADSVSYVEFIYTLHKDNYRIGFDVAFVGMNKYIDPRASTVDVNWVQNLYRQEKGFTNENNYTTIAYKHPDGSTKDMNASKSALEENIKTRLDWINFKQHFFSSILVTNGSVNNKLNYTSHSEDNLSNFLKTCEANFQIEFNSRENTTIPMEFYFAPNHFRTLKSHGHSFEKIIPLGGSIIGLINRFVVIPTFDLLRNSIASFGLIILILTLLIKLVMFPLTWKSYLSQANMRVLKPEVDKINAKYPDSKDAMKKQQEVMGLYKKTGVNMLGGCLPMLLQFPVLFALFRFFPSSFELRQQSFLWADDLSAFDSIVDLPFSVPFYGNHVSLFTLLMAVSLIISSKISMAQQGSNPQMKQMNIMMMYVMPIFMLAFFNNYSSGLTYYYFLSNLITIIQNVVIRKYFVDEVALLKKLNERATKHQPSTTKKKPSFTERLMQKQKELERLNKQQQKNKKK